MIQLLADPFVSKGNRTTLDGVKYLGGMKAEHAGVSKSTYTLTMNFLPKGVSGIIDDL
ncbi:hypothetical protein D1872_295310 [compost metagenome]